MDKDDKRVVLFAGVVTLALFLALVAGDINDFLLPPEKSHCDAACQAEMDSLTEELIDRHMLNIDRIIEESLKDVR